MATSVDLSWKGSGLSYAVIYAPRVGDVKADTLRTEQTSVSLTDLTPNTPYSVYVVSYCGAGYTLPSSPSATAYFNTPVLCSAPRIEVVEGSVTWQGVHLVIEAPVPDRQFRIIPKDEECPVERYELTSSKDTVKLYGFIDCENITYQVMARSLCLVDTSEWSEPVEFTTLPKPECGAPSTLWVGVNEGGRTATAHWTSGEKNKSWLLMYKEKSAQRYDSIEVRENSFTFYALKPNTVYTWRVQASCDHYLYSNLVYGEFNTAHVSLSSAQFADKLRMRVDANQIEIQNADGMYIKTLEVISMNGKRLKTYEIYSSDNVLIPHTLPFGPAVFRITGEGGETAVYKLMIP
ncbi:MAG: fibronectin type III domain-containing protein [Bacteroidales bacterium]|nr:fibronectin type III domain-containing protein [Bacteroidales bacterium]